MDIHRRGKVLTADDFERVVSQLRSQLADAEQTYRALWPLGYERHKHEDGGSSGGSLGSQTEAAFAQTDAVRQRLLDASLAIHDALTAARRVEVAINRGWLIVDSRIPQHIEAPDDRMRERSAFFAELADVHERKAKRYRVKAEQAKAQEAKMQQGKRKTVQPKTVSPEEAARQLGVALNVVYSLIATGKLPTLMVAVPRRERPVRAVRVKHLRALIKAQQEADVEGEGA